MLHRNSLSPEEVQQKVANTKKKLADAQAEYEKILQNAHQEVVRIYMNTKYNRNINHI